MGPFDAIRTGLTKSFQFKGRASRSEFWHAFQLSTILAILFQIAAFIAAMVHFNRTTKISREELIPNDVITLILVITVVIFCVVMLPASSRRFQDCGWNGAWFGYAAFANYVAGCVAIVGLCFALFHNHEVAQKAAIVSLLCVLVPNTSVVMTAWIGFVRSQPSSNKYGPNPHDRYSPNPHEVPS